MIIALNLCDMLLSSPLTHAAIYDYRPSNLVISILSLTRQIYDYRLEPGDINIIIALHTRNL
jgi:hypothetical protein